LTANGAGMKGILNSLPRVLGLLDGSNNEILPKDMNFLDMLAISGGIITPREINASPLLVNYIR
jgi:hypothetical protein